MSEFCLFFKNLHHSSQAMFCNLRTILNDFNVFANTHLFTNYTRFQNLNSLKRSITSSEIINIAICKSLSLSQINLINLHTAKNIFRNSLKEHFHCVYSYFNMREFRSYKIKTVKVLLGLSKYLHFYLHFEKKTTCFV